MSSANQRALQSHWREISCIEMILNPCVTATLNACKCPAYQLKDLSKLCLFFVFCFFYLRDAEYSIQSEHPPQRLKIFIHVDPFAKLLSPREHKDSLRIRFFAGLCHGVFLMWECGSETEKRCCFIIPHIWCSNYSNCHSKCFSIPRVHRH